MSAPADDVLAALNEIVDPCSKAAGVPGGLVDLGLVRLAEVAPGPQGSLSVRVVLSVTHPFCMMAGVFVHEAEKKLRALRDWGGVEVTMDSGVLWSEALMRPDYALRLSDARRKRNDLAR